MHHRCFICCGSNTDQERSFETARQELQAYFPSIRFSEGEYTIPHDLENKDLFYNQIAEFSTSLPPEEVQMLLKGIEHACGRKLDDKEKEIVRMDIDLIQYDEDILKEDDFERPYVKRGMQELEK